MNKLTPLSWLHSLNNVVVRPLGLIQTLPPFYHPRIPKFVSGPARFGLYSILFQVWILTINMPSIILLPVMHIIRFNKDLTMNINTNAVPIVSEVTFRSSMGGRAQLSNPCILFLESHRHETAATMFLHCGTQMYIGRIAVKYLPEARILSLTS